MTPPGSRAVCFEALRRGVADHQRGPQRRDAAIGAHLQSASPLLLGSRENTHAVPQRPPSQRTVHVERHRQGYVRDGQDPLGDLSTRSSWWRATAIARWPRTSRRSSRSPLTKGVCRRFADMEVFVEIQENVRGTDVFVIQSTSFPANDNLMELLILIDALKRASARRINAVMPYFGYARQDRKPGPRTPISAKLVANLIERAGADRVLTLDLHAGQIQGFFDIPTDNLFAAPTMVKDIKARFELSNLMVVSPDVGGVVRARALAKRIDAPIAICDKRRERAGESEVMNVIGDVARQALHPGRRHRRFRRHAVQCRRGAAEERRDRGDGLHHPRRAVRRCRRQDPELEPEVAGDHRTRSSRPRW